MSFNYPGVLFFLVIPLALLIWTWRRQSGRLVLPLDHGRAGSGRGWRLVLNLAESLPALVLAIVLILLAGPQRLGEPHSRRALTNIELCVDVSFSMTAPFGDGTRYDTSMRAINDFLDFRKGDAVGLTFFGNNVLHWVPLTSDASAIRCAPPFMRPEVAPIWMQGTEIGRALRACRKVLAGRQEGDRMVILITDGLSADLFGGNDLTIARELKESQVAVYAIHIGDEPLPGEVVNITGITGGEVFQPDDPAALKEIFRRIDQMQQTKLEKTIGESLDFFAPFCAVGVVLLALALLALFGLRYVPW